jgi:hypothetical protein
LAALLTADEIVLVSNFLLADFWTFRVEALLRLGRSCLCFCSLGVAETALKQALQDIGCCEGISPKLKPAVLLLLQSVYGFTRRPAEAAQIATSLLEYSRLTDTQSGRPRKSLTAFRETALEVCWFSINPSAQAERISVALFANAS